MLFGGKKPPFESELQHEEGEKGGGNFLLSDSAALHQTLLHS
jgi:hypothetical protein